MRFILALLLLSFLPSETLGRPGPSGGREVVVRYLKQEISSDPAARLWENIRPVRIPLKAQDIAEPYGGGSVETVTIRAVHDGEMVAFLLEWADSVKDATTDTPDSFRDAAALMFPLDPQNPAQPLMGHRYMGERSALVNIWQFKADWNEAGRDSPVEDLNAAGPGTLSTQAQQNVLGKGMHEGGRWKVVFLRSLRTKDEDDAQFRPGLGTWVNVAVWNGSRKDRAGQKSVSDIWHDLVFESAPVGIFPDKKPDFPR